jgi:hypothetical protein
MCTTVWMKKNAKNVIPTLIIYTDRFDELMYKKSQITQNTSKGAVHLVYVEVHYGEILWVRKFEI